MRDRKCSRRRPRFARAISPRDHHYMSASQRLPDCVAYAHSGYAISEIHGRGASRTARIEKIHHLRQEQTVPLERVEVHVLEPFAQSICDLQRIRLQVEIRRSLVAANMAAAARWPANVVHLDTTG